MNDQQPITAIVVLYYSKHLIQKLVENITEKITELDEIILIDNSNEDLSEFENDILKVIHPVNNIGYGAAINIGIKIAKNDIVVAMNPDIEITKWELPPDIISNTNILASGIPNEWISIRKFPSLTYDILRLSLINLAKPFRLVNALYGFTSLDNIKKNIPVDWISGALIITNKNTMNQLGGFDEEYFLFFEEVDLCKRAELLGIPRHILHTVYFNLNHGTSSSIDVKEIKITSEFQSAKRYHSKFSGRILTTIMFSIFKLYCFAIATCMTVLSVIMSNTKLANKAKQFEIYAKST